MSELRFERGLLLLLLAEPAPAPDPAPKAPTEPAMEAGRLVVPLDMMSFSDG